MSIDIQGLNKTFGDKHVLKDISYSFQPGKVNMIIGASGSGKSVLLKCLVGLVRPETGEIRYENHSLLDLDESGLRILRRRIGMLFQSAALFDSMTVAENIAFPLRMFSNQGGRKIHRRVDDLLERVNMPGTGHLYPSEISGGMRKRVGIARAIALEPEYLFCDEPNSGLDPQTAEVIDDLLRKLTNDLQITTIVVSHDMKSVLTIGDTVLFIHQGFAHWQGTREDLVDANDRVLRRFIETSGVQMDLDSTESAQRREAIPLHLLRRRHTELEPERPKRQHPDLPIDPQDPAAS